MATTGPALGSPFYYFNFAAACSEVEVCVHQALKLSSVVASTVGPCSDKADVKRNCELSKALRCSAVGLLLAGAELAAVSAVLADVDTAVCLCSWTC